jgi:hypothetical protein
MKTPLRLVLGILVASLAFFFGLVIYSNHFEKTPIAPSSHQEAGQAALNQNFLKGGELQRGLLGNENPQEFIQVETSTESPSFITRSFTVHAGDIVSVTLRNHSKIGQSHDWVLVKPGTRAKVQKDARNTPEIWDWIPESSDVLAVVPLTKPGESTIGLFKAPSKPGDYPFLSTYAGRGNAMNGVLHVIS